MTEKLTITIVKNLPVIDEKTKTVKQDKDGNLVMTVEKTIIPPAWSKLFEETFSQSLGNASYQDAIKETIGQLSKSTGPKPGDSATVEYKDEAETVESFTVWFVAPNTPNSLVICDRVSMSNPDYSPKNGGMRRQRGSKGGNSTPRRADLF